MARNFDIPAFDVALTKVTYHEGSTIFSYDCETELTLEQLRQPMTELIEAIRDEVDRQEGIIGHIKAYVEDSGASISMSCTGDEVYTTTGKQRTTVLHFAAILFAVEEDPIVELMDRAFSEI